MGWQLSPCLVQFRREVNGRWPNRNKASDGTIGDASHSARYSDHNPDVGGWVDAIDITHSPEHGLDVHHLFRLMAANPDPRIKYLISAGQIWNPKYDKPGQWRTYNGWNKHTRHAHMSILNSGRMSTAAWLPRILDLAPPPTPLPPPVPPPERPPAPPPPPHHPHQSPNRPQRATQKEQRCC